MLTRFVLSSVIHGCSSIFHGMPRRLGFFSKLFDVGQLVCPVLIERKLLTSSR